MKSPLHALFFNMSDAERLAEIQKRLDALQDGAQAARDCGLRVNFAVGDAGGQTITVEVVKPIIAG